MQTCAHWSIKAAFQLTNLLTYGRCGIRFPSCEASGFLFLRECCGSKICVRTDNTSAVKSLTHLRVSENMREADPGSVHSLRGSSIHFEEISVQIDDALGKVRRRSGSHSQISREPTEGAVARSANVRKVEGGEGWSVNVARPSQDGKTVIRTGRLSEMSQWN